MYGISTFRPATTFQRKPTQTLTFGATATGGIDPKLKAEADAIYQALRGFKLSVNDVVECVKSLTSLPSDAEEYVRAGFANIGNEPFQASVTPGLIGGTKVNGIHVEITIESDQLDAILKESANFRAKNRNYNGTLSFYDPAIVQEIIVQAVIKKLIADQVLYKPSTPNVELENDKKRFGKGRVFRAKDYNGADVGIEVVSSTS